MRHEKARTSNLLVALGVGAGCMYLLDPVSGKRRRTRIRDKFVRFSHALEEGTGTAARDLTNRTWGMASAVTRVFHRTTNDDAVLEPRVRSEMGRWVSHPHAIHVEARGGCIILSGDILESEQHGLIRQISRVPGVREVESRLRVHGEGENFPTRHDGKLGEPRFELLQSHWAPGPRLLSALSGAAMVGSGLRSRGIIGWSTVVGGALLLVRAVTNVEFARLLGRGLKPEMEKHEPRDSGVSIPITRKEPKEYRVH